MIRSTVPNPVLSVLSRSEYTAMQRCALLVLLFGAADRPLSTHEVADALGESMPTARAALSVLARDGVARRDVELRDGRAVAVFDLGGAL